MTKEEAIEKLKQQSSQVYDDRAVALGTAIAIVKQIDCPKKIVVPKFVADWLTRHKHENSLFDVVNMAVDYVKGNADSVVGDVRTTTWIGNLKHYFAHAWLFGYEVEVEKYRVFLPNPNSDREGYPKIILEKIGDKVYLVERTSEAIYPNNERQMLTEAEIKQDFEWAWQFAMKVED